MGEGVRSQAKCAAAVAVTPDARADYAEQATEALLLLRQNMDAVYGPCADEKPVYFNALKGEGSVAQLLDFVAAEA